MDPGTDIATVRFKVSRWHCGSSRTLCRWSLQQPVMMLPPLAILAVAWILSIAMDGIKGGKQASHRGQNGT